jgi:F420-non-reducing hydrogenase iron-sulfur subunit
MKVLVFSTDKISDPAIDLAGLLKKLYPAGVYTISVPCSSAIKPGWIIHALQRGFDGVFIAADGTDCPYGEQCVSNTANLVSATQKKMIELGIAPQRLKMAAVCSICAEPFVRHINTYIRDLQTI